MDYYDSYNNRIVTRDGLPPRTGDEITVNGKKGWFDGYNARTN